MSDLISLTSVVNRQSETSNQYGRRSEWEMINSSLLTRTEEPVKPFVVERLEIALDYILNHLTKRISIGDIALAAALSRFHLIRSFRAHFGITPIQLHLSLKIERAKDLMERKPDLKIKDVALKMGYSDIFTFSRHFKKATGYSPRHFKELKITKSLNCLLD